MRPQRIQNTLHDIVIRKTTGRLAVWTYIVAIAILALIPADKIARTGVGGHVEHVFGFAGMALIVAMVYADRSLGRILFALLAYAGALEFLQRFSPGRISRIEDFMCSAGGILLGLAAYLLVTKVLWCSSRLSTRNASNAGMSRAPSPSLWKQRLS
jgi:hypothetical protein